MPLGPKMVPYMGSHMLQRHRKNMKKINVWNHQFQSYEMYFMEDVLDISMKVSETDSAGTRGITQSGQINNLQDSIPSPYASARLFHHYLLQPFKP